MVLSSTRTGIAPTVSRAHARTFSPMARLPIWCGMNSAGRWAGLWIFPSCMTAATRPFSSFPMRAIAGGRPLRQRPLCPRSPCEMAILANWSTARVSTTSSSMTPIRRIPPRSSGSLWEMGFLGVLETTRFRRTSRARSPNIFIALRPRRHFRTSILSWTTIGTGWAPTIRIRTLQRCGSITSFPKRTKCSSGIPTALTSTWCITTALMEVHGPVPRMGSLTCTLQRATRTTEW